MANPSVALIIATKNRINSLRRCLMSWRDQDYDNYEVIVVDDGGTEDLTPIKIICEKWFPKITFLRMEGGDRPPNKAWNYGYKNSKSDFAIFTGSDLIVSSKSAISMMIEQHTGIRISVITYFLNEPQTALLDTLDWKDNARIIETLPAFWSDHSHGGYDNQSRLAAGIHTYLSGHYRKEWDWFGGFRDEEYYFVADHDIHARERFLQLGNGVCCETVKGLWAYHQWHLPAKVSPNGYIYEYANEAQARLLEPAKCGGTVPPTK